MNRSDSYVSLLLYPALLGETERYIWNRRFGGPEILEGFSATFRPSWLI